MSKQYIQNQINEVCNKLNITEVHNIIKQYPYLLLAPLEKQLNFWNSYYRKKKFLIWSLIIITILYVPNAVFFFRSYCDLYTKSFFWSLFIVIIIFLLLYLWFLILFVRNFPFCHKKKLLELNGIIKNDIEFKETDIIKEFEYNDKSKVWEITFPVKSSNKKILLARNLHNTPIVPVDGKEYFNGDKIGDWEVVYVYYKVEVEGDCKDNLPNENRTYYYKWWQLNENRIYSNDNTTKVTIVQSPQN